VSRPVTPAPEVAVLDVVDGALPAEQWVYAAVGADGAVLHVGSTGLPLAVRAWLHLSSEEPGAGRLRATVAPEDLRRAVVVGVRVPDDVDRTVVREEAARLLQWRERTATEPAACALAPAAGAAGTLAAALLAAVDRAADRTGV
jgi:hypothetical protein